MAIIIKIYLNYTVLKKTNRRLKTNDEKVVNKINELLDSGITKQKEIAKELGMEYNKKLINLIKYIKKRRMKERSTTIEQISIVEI